MRGGRAALGLAAALAFALPAPGSAQGGRGGLAHRDDIDSLRIGFRTAVQELVDLARLRK